jgi:hypothetical protein
MSNRCTASVAVSRAPSGSASTNLRMADATADPRPRACEPRRDPATRRASASSWFKPVSSVRKPGKSSNPPWRPRSAYTGTPAADSASMSRSTVRVDTSSSCASAAADKRPRWRSSSISETNRSARTSRVLSEYTTQDVVIRREARSCGRQRARLASRMSASPHMNEWS